MSRTDAHRPYRVWLADHPELAVAEHCHGAELCDLPNDRASSGTRCQWILTEAAPRLCSCSLCGGGIWHRLDVRRRRRADKLALRQRPHDGDKWADIEARLLRH